ncbi:hypothetical protein [Streptomyces sp. ISL-10]|uniref:hypothetical protein n=1 Tax=Streptomyces sp. ISL-10 TaxID=2819172 RepID=UPI00203614AA|nr:hypothetical protein [Streptomyces sp. ISL-10]
MKDLTLRAVRGASGEEMEVEFQHNCWKHDQDLLIRYTGVIIDPTDEDRGTDLGTVILDEILPHRDGCSHEIACWDGNLIIVCCDLQATWTKIDCSSES